MDDELKKYRDHLVEARQKSLESFDRNLLALSGTALAISMTFLRDIVGDGPIDNICLIILAWSCWLASIAVVLTSFYASHLSLSKAIQQVDDGTIYEESPGGGFTRVITFLNPVGGVLFVIGLLLILIFMATNLR